MKEFRKKYNPHTRSFQYVTNKEAIISQAVELHTHNISDINDLEEKLDKLKTKTGYFAN